MSENSKDTNKQLETKNDLTNMGTYLSDSNSNNLNEFINFNYDPNSNDVLCFDDLDDIEKLINDAFNSETSSSTARSSVGDINSKTDMLDFLNDVNMNIPHAKAFSSTPPIHTESRNSTFDSVFFESSSTVNSENLKINNDFSTFTTNSFEKKSNNLNNHSANYKVFENHSKLDDILNNNHISPSNLQFDASKFEKNVNELDVTKSVNPGYTLKNYQTVDNYTNTSVDMELQSIPRTVNMPDMSTPKHIPNKYPLIKNYNLLAELTDYNEKYVNIERIHQNLTQKPQQKSKTYSFNDETNFNTVRTGFIKKNKSTNSNFSNKEASFNKIQNLISPIPTFDSSTINQVPFPSVKLEEGIEFTQQQQISDNTNSSQLIILDNNNHNIVNYNKNSNDEKQIIPDNCLPTVFNSIEDLPNITKSKHKCNGCFKVSRNAYGCSKQIVFKLPNIKSYQEYNSPNGYDLTFALNNGDPKYKYIQSDVRTQYDPLVKRYLNDVQVNKNGKKMKRDYPSLCPFCKISDNKRFDSLFYERNNSCYRGHLINTHGINSTGEFAKLPTAGFISYKLGKNSWSQTIGFRCPYDGCNSCFLRGDKTHGFHEYIRHWNRTHLE